MVSVTALDVGVVSAASDLERREVEAEVASRHLDVRDSFLDSRVGESQRGEEGRYNDGELHFDWKDLVFSIWVC